MKKITPVIMAVLTTLIFWATPSFSYEEASYSDVMAKLETQNEPLFKMAKKVYKYATNNTSDFIDKPILTRHNKGLNAFIDLDNKVSAKYYAASSDGLKSKLVMLFRFNGQEYKVIQLFSRGSKFSKWEAVD